VPGLVHRHLAERLQPDIQGPDGADDGGPVAGGLPGEPCRGRVDPFGVVGEAMRRQLDRVGAEGVGLQDLRAGPDVLPVDLLHQVGPAEIQLVVAHVEKDTTPVEHGAHRPVHHVDPAVGEEIAKRGHDQLRPSVRAS
jgi:hypothetical protein